MAIVEIAIATEPSMGLIQQIQRAIKGCDAVGHVPDRHRVRRAGGDFRTVCKQCGTTLVRYGPDDWRKDDER